MTDVAEMIAKILDSTTVMESEIANMGIYYPAKLFGYMSRPIQTVSYTHLRAHETVLDLVCRLLLEKKKTKEE